MHGCLGSPSLPPRPAWQVPEILHPLCSSRVLTMEFVHGANVCDGAALRRLRVAPDDVARLVATTFSEMIFTFGDVSSLYWQLPSCSACMHVCSCSYLQMK